MPLRLPTLQTSRLSIRDFRRDDLKAIHRILDREIDPARGLAPSARQQWLEWSILSYGQLADLHQPPYGDRAVTLSDTGELIGAVGYSPMFHPIAEMLTGVAADRAQWLPEMGLYWALSPQHRGKGYATEAAQALIDYAFANFPLKRIVANTEFANLASQQVMQRLGMRLYRNTTGVPDWFEVLGVIEQPGSNAAGRFWSGRSRGGTP